MPQLSRPMACVAAVSTCSLASAGPVTVGADQPSLDRWMYPFNATPGLRLQAAIFATLLPGFDDRDAQFVIGFDTSAWATPGQGAGQYHVRSARVVVTSINADQFKYDPTPDPIGTMYDPQDPEYIPDADEGKPIDLFGVGFRNGVNAATFCETCPFGGPPLVPPAEGARNVYAAVFNTSGAATDVSRQVRQRIDAAPMAVGVSEGLTPGQLVPANAPFVFDVNLCDATVRAYFERAFDQGTLLLAVTTLQITDGGSGGGTNPNYPVLYTKENPIAVAGGYTARLEVVLNSGLRSDFNNDGVLNLADFGAFQTQFALGAAGADVNADCALNLADFGAFQTLFALGL